MQEMSFWPTVESALSGPEVDKEAIISRVGQASFLRNQKSRETVQRQLPICALRAVRH